MHISVQWNIAGQRSTGPRKCTHQVVRVIQAPAAFGIHAEMICDAVTGEQAHKTRGIELQGPGARDRAGQVRVDALRNNGTNANSQIEIIRFGALSKCSSRHKRNTKQS